MTGTIVPRARNIPAGRRGRPISPETLSEHIEGHAMGVVMEDNEAAGYIERAIAIDAKCDRLTREAVCEADAVLRCLSAGDIESARVHARRERSDLVEIARLDAAEGAVWQREAPAHIAEATAEAREIIHCCQPSQYGRI